MTKATLILKKRAWQAIREFEPEMRELSLRILRHPEL